MPDWYIDIRLGVCHNIIMEAADIKKLRKRLKLSQIELADKLGVDPTTISRWERKEQRPSQLAMVQLNRLARKVSR